jgi:hypothetical protein
MGYLLPAARPIPVFDRSTEMHNVLRFPGQY